MAAQRTSRERQKQAERAAEHYLRKRCGCVATVRAMTTRFARQDLFASDVLGKDSAGRLIAAQVTCGDRTAVRPRRRKMEAVPWSKSDMVLLLEFREEKIGPRKWFWFRVHEYDRRQDDGGPIWNILRERENVPQEWFRAYREIERATA